MNNESNDTGRNTDDFNHFTANINNVEASTKKE